MSKAIEGQIERDSRILDLLVTMHNVYAFVDTLQNMADLTPPLENNIDLALKQTIECALFIREYFGIGFAGQDLVFLLAPSANKHHPIRQGTQAEFGCVRAEED